MLRNHIKLVAPLRTVGVGSEKALGVPRVDSVILASLPQHLAHTSAVAPAEGVVHRRLCPQT